MANMPKQTAGYDSKFKDWDSPTKGSSVRARPRRMIGDEEGGGGIFFPPEFMPITQHSEVMALGPQVIEEISIQGLYQYLHFTNVLEENEVNPVLMQIAQRKLGLELTSEMLMDARRIYVDEGYHSLFSADLLHQIEAETDVQFRQSTVPNFTTRLFEVESTVSPKLRDMVRMFFVVVSETLISATLNKLPKDRRVVKAVRDVIADHAFDE